MALILPTNQPKGKREILRELDIIQESLEEAIEVARSFESADKHRLMMSQFVIETGFMTLRKSLNYRE